MSKASDIIEPVLNDLLSDITDRVNENNTIPNISTMNEPSETNRLNWIFSFSSYRKKGGNLKIK